MFIRSNSRQIAYIKNQTPFYANSHYRIHIKFSLQRYQKQPKRKNTLQINDLERLDVFDPNRYNKLQLQEMILDFFKNYDYLTFQNQIKAFSNDKYIQNYSFVYEINPELYELFYAFLNERKDIQKVRFKNATDIHINFISNLMLQQKTRNLTVSQKTRLLKEEFPNLKIGRSTVYKIQKKLLRYSYKRVAQYEPKYLGNKQIKRISFIKRYFEILQDNNSILFVLDEVGIGTETLRKYAYSKIGVPVVLKKSKLLSHNMTCTATISPFCVETLRFFYEGGTKNEYFHNYFKKLVSQLKNKYPNKKLVILLDNLWVQQAFFNNLKGTQIMDDYEHYERRADIHVTLTKQHSTVLTDWF